MGYLGFLVSPDGAPEDRIEGQRGVLAHTGGFAVYAAMVSYLMVREADTTGVDPALATAMGLHFLSLNHFFCTGTRPLRARAGMSAPPPCWPVGERHDDQDTHFRGLRPYWAGSGGHHNSMIAELPREGEGKFLLVWGAGTYAAIVLLATG